MISKISKAIINIIVKVHPDSELTKYQEVYLYVLFVIINYIYFFSYTTILGILLNIVFESIIFFIAFTFLRRYAGGYHASSENRCLLLSSIMFLLSVLIIKVLIVHVHVINKFSILFFCTLVSFLIIFLSPVDCPEKPIEQEQKKKTKLKTLFTVITFLILIIIFINIKNLIRLSYPLIVTISLQLILLIAGKYKYKKRS